MCFGTRGIVLDKSRDVDRVEDTGSVSNMGGKENRDVDGKRGYIYLSFCNFLIQLVLWFNKYKTVQPSSCTTTRHNMSEKPRDNIQYS